MTIWECRQIWPAAVTKANNNVHIEQTRMTSTSSAIAKLSIDILDSRFNHEDHTGADLNSPKEFFMKIAAKVNS
jgi:hypothetical protein